MRHPALEEIRKEMENDPWYVKLLRWWRVKRWFWKRDIAWYYKKLTNK